jgi:hypothetical protein
MAVPNIFGTATSAIPLSQLDTNFATPVTIGNTAVQLGNTVTSFGNVTLTNVTISSGNVTVTGANVSGTANVSTLIVTGNATIAGTATTIQGLTVGKGAGAGSANTALGVSALTSAAGSNFNTALGYQSGFSTSTGNGANSFVGYQSGYAVTTGESNSFFGTNSAKATTTGSYNVAIGKDSLQANTTASNNTAVGYQAGFSITTGAGNAIFGQGAGYSLTTGTQNTFIGAPRVGVAGCGDAITTGSKNTILGSYNGNQGGLDIRTADNNIVLSDGDGNPRFNYSSANVNWSIPYLGKTGTSRGANTILNLNSGATSYDGSIQITDAVANNVWWGLLNGAAYVMTNSGGVALTNGATSWVSASDSRLKNVTGIYENALSDITQIQPVKFTWKDDAKNKAQVGVLAQSVQAVVPEAVESLLSSEDGIEYLHVRYTELIPLMIASIQELKAEIDALKGA